jgi:hypothetical protein
MSQKTHLKILRCVVVLKVFSKKRNFWFKKTGPLLLLETILNVRRLVPLFCFVMILLLPARNKQILPSLPLIRLHQE